MFDRLDFIYLPSLDVAADVEHYTEGLGGELVFAIERFGTRVAMVRRRCRRTGSSCSPSIWTANSRSLSSESTSSTPRPPSSGDAAVELGAPFEMPYGHGVEVKTPGPQRIAVYEMTRPDRGEGLAGRRDF